MSAMKGHLNDQNMTTLGRIIDGTNASHSNSTDFQSDDVFLQRIISVMVPLLFGSIFLIGLTGNSVVISVICWNKKMMNSTTVLILNLAVSDLLFIIFCVPTTGMDYLSIRTWMFGSMWCKTVHYLIHATACVSIYTLVLMSVDRFIAIVLPIGSVSLRTVNRTRKYLLITWTFSFLVCLPFFFFYGEVTYVFASEIRAVCKFIENDTWLMAIHVAFFILSYLAPFTIICFLYSRILCKLWDAKSSIRTTQESLQSKKRVTVMVAAIIVSFAFCWFPIQIILLLKSFQLFVSDSKEKILIQIISNGLAYTNSCLNPILYAFMFENFRASLKSFFSFKCLIKNRTPEDSHIASLNGKC